jgi:hypothetical protein
MTQNFQGHKYAERLRPEEKKLVQELTDNMAAPRNIMATLKKRRKTTATTMKHIYNARYRMKKVDRGLRTEMQHLMKCLVEGKYLFNQRVLPSTETLSDILWAHPDSVKLFNTFSTVLIVAAEPSAIPTLLPHDLLHPLASGVFAFSGNRTMYP